MRSVFRRLSTELPFYLLSVNPNPIQQHAVVFGVRRSSDSSWSDFENQFDEFRRQLKEDRILRDRIQSVSSEIESAAARMRSDLLLVHAFGLTPDVLEKGTGHINVLRELYSKLAENIKDSPEQYDRYVRSSQTQMVVSQLALIHWLETESLLRHTEAEEKLALNSSKFGLHLGDYLCGLCIMSDELLRYTVNRVYAAGDYDCARKAYKLLEQLYSALSMFVLETDFFPDLLREKFDGMPGKLTKIQDIIADTRYMMENKASPWNESVEDSSLPFFPSRSSLSLREQVVGSDTGNAMTELKESSTD